jgi:hypothetical protein
MRMQHVSMWYGHMRIMMLSPTCSNVHAHMQACARAASRVSTPSNTQQVRERPQQALHKCPRHVTAECAFYSGLEASKGMRVRKSATRMAYIRENGWDDLSEGGDGTLISILVTCPLNPEPKAHSPQRFQRDKQASRALLVYMLASCAHDMMGVSVLVCMCRRETDGSVWCGGTTATKTSMQSGMADSTISRLPESSKINKER